MCVLCPQVRSLRLRAKDAWDFAYVLSDATGTKYKDRDGNWRNDKGDTSIAGMAMFRWCAKKGFQWS